MSKCKLTGISVAALIMGGGGAAPFLRAPEWGKNDIDEVIDIKYTMLSLDL